MTAPIKRVIQENATQNGQQGRIVELTDGRKVFLVGSSSPASTIPSTGNATLDGMVQSLKKQLDNTVAAGNTINPDITISPDQVQKFIDQAKDEIEPYYQTIYTQIKGDLQRHAADISTELAATAGQTTDQFGRNLRTLRDNTTENGTTFSGERVRNETQLATDAQRSLDAAQRTAVSAATDAARAAESQVGSSNVSDITAPTIQTPNIAGSFKPGQTTIASATTGLPSNSSALFSFSGGLSGTLEQQKLAAEKTREAELEKAYREQQARSTFNGG